MRINIESKGSSRTIHLHLPTALLCNAITAGILCKKSAKPEETSDTEIEINHRITYPQARKLMRFLRKCRHFMNGMPLVQIDGADGSKVEIHL